MGMGMLEYEEGVWSLEIDDERADFELFRWVLWEGYGGYADEKDDAESEPSSPGIGIDLSPFKGLESMTTAKTRTTWRWSQGSVEKLRRSSATPAK